MENATKALLMAAGILFTLIILSFIVYAYNMFSGSQQGKIDAEKAKQIAEFNLQYEAYNRNDVKGIELFSLYSKIIDYNLRIADDTTGEWGANKIDTNIYNLLKPFGFNGTIGSLTSEVKGYLFKCTGTEYDKNTGRINKITFEGPIR